MTTQPQSPSNLPLRHPPRQGRALATLEKILTAAEVLLEERLFEQVTIAQIARRAGVSVGTIYTRFPDKDSLLPALFERHNQVVEPQVSRLIEELLATGTLRARVELLVRFAVRYHRKKRGLLRALTMFTRAHPEAIPPELFRERATLYQQVGKALLGDGREVRHRDPKAAVGQAMVVLNSTTREQLLFGDVSPLGSPGPRALEKSLSTMLFGYLRGGGDGSTEEANDPETTD